MNFEGMNDVHVAEATKLLTEYGTCRLQKTPTQGLVFFDPFAQYRVDLSGEESSNVVSRSKELGVSITALFQIALIQTSNKIPIMPTRRVTLHL